VAGNPVFWGGFEGFGEREKERVLGRRLREACRGRTSWEALEPIYRRFQTKAWDPSHLNWMTYLDLNLRLPELLLMRVDKMSMGVSLEARVPFLDHRIVELAMSIPTATKVRGGELKRVLKAAVRGVIPQDVLDRPKQGFGVPIVEWFDQGLAATTNSRLEHLAVETDFLDAPEVARIGRTDGWKTWYLHNFAAWWAEYIQ
jgi:asparagine synthase (glutamine-hydrolysing)